MEQALRKKVPLVEGRIRIREDGTACLVGMRCPTCGEVFFPKGVVCRACGREGAEEVELSTIGKVWTYTVVHVSYGSIIATPPYATAFVELDGGGYVHTVLVDCEPDAVSIGMDVELELVKTGQSEDADTVVYGFKPAGQTGGAA